jgi:hypothetical protein
MAEHPLLAGTGRSDITPAPGTPQGGWGAQTHQRGVGADMPLYATALVLDGGEGQIAIVEADAIGFDWEWTWKILDAITALSGIPRERIRFSCSHTHSGPNTFRLANISEGLDMAVAYLEDLPRRIAGAVWQAQRSLRPVRCAAGEGRCEISVNRRFRAPDGSMVVGRNWEGPVDPTVRVVRFDDLEQNPVAVLLHYSCHGTTIAWQSAHFTPDFPGPARQVVEEQIGGTCLFLQGAAGNISPRGGFTGDLSVCRRLGRILGLEAARVALSIDTLPRRERFRMIMPSGANIALYDDDPPADSPAVLRMISRQIQLPGRSFRPPEELEAEVAALRRELERLRREGTEEEVRRATSRATQAGWRAGNSRLYYGRPHIDWPLQAIRIGSTALVSVAGEPFIETSAAIVADSPFAHTLVCGYTNGGFGYIPTSQAFEEGGYEVEASPFAPEAEGVLAAEAKRILRDL